MTTIDPSLSVTESAELVPVLAESAWDRFEAMLYRASDRLNPILVKEARQALRSRQFVVTFFLMLAAGWIWSILGLAAIGPAVYYTAAGPQMMFVYHLILSFPLLVVAPYSAFYSLSAERQDRTYELLSITALGARQILAGKMCGIALQMIVYLSAIFPCLAFTYLLRGLDVFTIVVVVLYTCCLSLALSVTGLMLGAIAPLRQRHIAVSVLFALVLFLAMFIDNSWTSAIMFIGGMSVDSPQFWPLQFILLTAFLNYFAIVFLCGRSQLLTGSENRSTALRWALVVAQLSFVVWMIWAQFNWGGMLFGLIYFSACGWFVAGIFLTAESSVLSPRVKRDLPTSGVGRMFLTWFIPGPGTGYMFVIGNMLALSVLVNLPYDDIAEGIRGIAASTGATGAITTGTVATTRMVGTFPRPFLGAAAIVATSYVAIYLGISTMIVRWVRRFAEVRLAAPVMVNICLLMLGCMVPWIMQLMSATRRDSGYTLWQLSNPVWTLRDICFGRVPADMPVIELVVPAIAIVVWLVNLPAICDELKQVRIAKPKRVEEEDAELAAAVAPAPGPKDPWDHE